jgi:hypothetical protein
VGSRSSFGLLLSIALGMAGLAASGCGEHETASGPTGPSPGLTPSSTLLPLQPGPYLMNLTGFAASSGSDVPLCSPPGIPRDGTNVLTSVDLQQEGTEFVARGRDGSLTLRIRGTSGTFFRAGVEGDILGSARDEGSAPVLLPRDIHISIAGEGNTAAPARVEGTSDSGRFLWGQIVGAVTFSEGSGASSTCSTINWTLQPIR